MGVEHLEMKGLRDLFEKAKNNSNFKPCIKETGIQASYTEDIEDNDSYVSKIKPQLQATPPQ